MCLLNIYVFFLSCFIKFIYTSIWIITIPLQTLVMEFDTWSLGPLVSISKWPNLEYYVGILLFK